jgi:hypothetical protein
VDRETSKCEPKLVARQAGTLQRELGAARPSFLSYRVRIVDSDPHGYSPEISLRTVDGARVLFVGAGSVAPEGTDWFEVQLRDIDWTHGTFDIYTVVDGKCQRVSDDRAFEPKPGNLSLALYEDELGAAQLDDLVIQ